MTPENADEKQMAHMEYYEKLQNAANDFDLRKLATLCIALSERKELARIILNIGGINEDQSKQIFHYHNENIKKILGL